VNKGSEMTEPWLKNYPDNVSPVIDVHQFSSLVDLFEQSNKRYASQSAFSNFGTEITYEQVDEFSKQFAAYLQTVLGIRKGDRVALMCPNTLCFPIAMWGIIQAGAIQVNVNPMYTARELKHQLNDAQVDTIVIFAPSTKILADIVEDTAIKNIITINLDDITSKGLPHTPVDERIAHSTAFMDALSQGKDLNFMPPKLTIDDLVFLQYTGGTTGLSKGAMLNHGNLVANILQYQEFSKNVITYGEEIVITAIPMYHIFALMANCLSYYYFGAKNLLITNPRDMASFVETWKNTPATMFTGVNTLFNGLLHTPGFSDIDFSSLKLSIGGGASVQQAVADKWQEVTKVRLHEGYGLSETSPILTLNFGYTRNGISEYTPGIGIPMPNTDISIRDDEGNVVADGETGELCAKGPQVMPGYWNNKEATAETMTSDGYFKTGDVAMIDTEGFFHIVDRKKDMIIVSGFNVYPNEIEAEVANMPGLLESACIGVADDKTGEAVKLFAVKEDQSITQEQVIEFCRTSLTAYKIPKQVIFIDEIPKSSVGKLLRRELR